MYTFSQIAGIVYSLALKITENMERHTLLKKNTVNFVLYKVQ
jgi:hypothetical protein